MEDQKKKAGEMLKFFTDKLDEKKAVSQFCSFCSRSLCSQQKYEVLIKDGDAREVITTASIM